MRCVLRRLAACALCRPVLTAAPAGCTPPVGCLASLSVPACPAWIAGWVPPTWHHALAPPRATPCQVTNVLMAAGISVSSANINTGSGEGPVRDVFRVTDGEGKKVGGRTVAPLGARATHAASLPAAVQCDLVP